MFKVSSTVIEKDLTPGSDLCSLCLHSFRGCIPSSPWDPQPSRGPDLRRSYTSFGWRKCYLTTNRKFKTKERHFVDQKCFRVETLSFRFYQSSCECLCVENTNLFKILSTKTRQVWRNFCLPVAKKRSYSTARFQSCKIRLQTQYKLMAQKIATKSLWIICAGWTRLCLNGRREIGNIVESRVCCFHQHILLLLMDPDIETQTRVESVVFNNTRPVRIPKMFWPEVAFIWRAVDVPLRRLLWPGRRDFHG